MPPEDLVYVRAPDGTIGTIPASQQQDAVNAGYTAVSRQEGDAAAAAFRAREGEAAALKAGVTQAPADYSPALAFSQKALSAFTFSLAPEVRTPEAVAAGQRFAEEHPYAAFGAEFVGQLPLAVGAGIVGEAAIGGVAAAGLARVGGVATREAARGVGRAIAATRTAEFGAQALLGGAQTEAEQTRLAQDEFSWTDAAVSGLPGEAIGRGAAAAFSAALGVRRNLIARATRATVAADAESALTRGGVLNDFRVAHHADQYQNELATLAADDLDRLETAFAEVSRQDRKRARVVRVVEDRPQAQAAIRAEALAGLGELRTALAAELGETPGGPARALLRQLDERAEALAQTRGGAKRLWRLLDENRQALQDYAQDVHQAYENAPGSAWLSRDGLAALDAAEKVTREALLREDAWGRAAVDAQAAYNVPFHEKYFPTAKTVRGKLMFSTQNDARGFPVFRGDPARVRAFFTRGVDDVDGARLSEQFRDYLEGVEAIARAGEGDTPRAARDALEAVRRLRKAAATAEFVRHAAARSADRGRFVEVGVEAGVGALGAAAAGPVAGAVAFGALRGARAGDFLLRAARKLGWGAGEAESMAKLLGREELPAVAGRDAEPNIVDDVLDGSEPPPGGGTPPAGPGGGLTPSMRADAARASWTPSAPPGATAPEELAGPASIAAPVSPREAPTRPVPGGAPEAHRGTMEAIETDPLRELGVAGRAEARRLEALTEGEFRDVVRQLRASDAPEAKAFATRLEKARPELEADGMVFRPTEKKPPREAPSLDEVDEFYRRRAAESARPSTAVDARLAAANSAASTLRGLGLQIRMGEDRLGDTLETVFGLDRTPTAEQWAQLIPLETLAKLGPPDKARIDILGDAFIWSAEGPASADFSDDAWRISRTFARDDEGRLVVHHDHFFIRDDLQNTGVGAEVLREMMNAYRKVGVDLVEVDAIQVGRYFWPSIGFNCTEDALRQAKEAYTRFVQETLSADEAWKAVDEAARVRSLPALAQTEYGKQFLLTRSGAWNYDLKLELKDENPLYHLMRGRLDVAAAALAIGGELEGVFRDPREKDHQAAVAGAPFGAAVLALKGGRARLVRDVARRLFSSAAEPAARVTARLAYSRAQLDARREEIASWAENPNALVERVAEGLRDAPPEAFASAAAGVYAAAGFLREKLPQPHQPSPVSIGRGVPVSAEAAAKYARYEQAALRPGDAWREAAESGYISPELLETTQELYPDLLAEVRVEAYQAIRSGGPPRTIQAKAQYARLFDGDGTLADAAFSPTAVQMVNYAYEQQAAVAPPKPSSGRVSQTAAAVAAPRPWSVPAA